MSAGTPAGPDRTKAPNTAGRRSLGDRLEDAAPLVVPGMACAAMALFLRAAAAPVLVGRIEVWSLFVALAIIAAVGAIVSFLIEEIDGEPEAQPISSRSDTRDSSGSLTSSTRASRTTESAPTRGPAARFVPAVSAAAAPAWHEADGDVELPSLPPSKTVGVRRTSPPSSRRGPDLADAAAEAIEELDRVWRDLERLRRPARRAPPV